MSHITPNLQMFESLLTTMISEFDSTSNIDLNQNLTKLESMGYRLGQMIVERSTINATPKTEIESLKFVCKSVWPILFNKEIDRLTTNRAGTYILIDNTFPFYVASWCEKSDSSRKSKTPENSDDDNKAVPSDYTLIYISFIGGIIRGALCCSGHVSMVTSEITGEESSFKLQVAISSNFSSAAVGSNFSAQQSVSSATSAS